MIRFAWWRHQMKTFSVLLAICAENSPVPDEIPAQRPVTRSFGVFFDLRLNKRLSKQSWGWWFETLPRPLCRHSYVVESHTYRSIQPASYPPSIHPSAMSINVWAIQVLWDLARFLRSFKDKESNWQNVIKIGVGLEKCNENKPTFIMSAVPADGLATLGAETSVAAIITNFRFRICTGATFELLIITPLLWLYALTYVISGKAEAVRLGPFLLTCFNFNPSMDKWSHAW